MQEDIRLNYIFLVIFLFSTIFLNFILVFQTMDNLLFFDTDQENNFNDLNLKLSAQDINITTPENNTYTKPMSGYFPASYGFENDIVGENPQNWVTDETYGE
ncbi:MAG: hypothetical protein ACFFAI_00005, partial [Promethearchaeota archaeon]